MPEQKREDKQEAGRGFWPFDPFFCRAEEANINQEADGVSEAASATCEEEGDDDDGGDIRHAIIKEREWRGIIQYQ